MSDENPEKRNSTDGMTDPGPDCSGVGGRQEERPGRQRGGGYLDICTSQSSGSGRDARIRELRQIGLSRPWIQIAERFGPDRFLELWRMLDRPELIEQEGRLRFTMPRFRQYERFQRNQFIRAQASAGCNALEIRGLVERELGERISVKHITRLMKG